MTIWQLAVYLLAVLLIVVVMLGLFYVLGQRNREPATGSQYELGIASQGSAHSHVPVKFFLVAAFFVVFDLEGVFLFLWAVAGRELGWPGYLETLIFVGILLTALVYLLRTGALDWCCDLAFVSRARRRSTRRLPLSLLATTSSGARLHGNAPLARGNSADCRLSGQGSESSHRRCSA